MFVNNNHLPEWILDIKKPVPMDQMVYLSKGKADIYKSIYDAVDGNRSISDLAFLIEKDLNIDSIQLAQIILGHFTELYEDFQNGRHRGVY